MIDVIVGNAQEKSFNPKSISVISQPQLSRASRCFFFPQNFSGCADMRAHCLRDAAYASSCSSFTMSHHRVEALFFLVSMAAMASLPKALGRSVTYCATILRDMIDNH
jgi:hypothetical protein